ncbi:MAG TPA: arginine repressor [Planctomycetota bacterium]|nr:arginine repressor [Planctomycetota bacterium]
MQIRVKDRRAGRHEAILRAVGEGPVRTQEELRRKLAARGFPVDQGTLSRDVRELGLVKVPGQDGQGTHYALAAAPAATAGSDPAAAVARFSRGADWSGNLVVIATDAGNAGLLGIAVDRLGWKEVLGTIAGDDTLLVVVREGARARAVAERIKALAGI